MKIEKTKKISFWDRTEPQKTTTLLLLLPLTSSSQRSSSDSSHTIDEPAELVRFFFDCPY
ncbi:hypothetical protein TorRG33x02_244260 [Trema orientale]|uniref:Uncharacterized protein n=1 Tax=Trema orientale TaxID=63057 RepID=A0A2P5DRA8_TREOI|nr:hypothetical protein TorRG33x02_244260 [Trema orientale]